MLKIIGASSNYIAEVNEQNELQVALSKILDKSGYGIAVSEVDGGASLPLNEKTLRPHDSSSDYRLRVGLDSILWDDTFNHTQFNTSKYLGVTSTMTMGFAGGAFILNLGNSTTSGHVARKQTIRTFPIFGTYGCYVDLWFGFNNPLQANSVHELGLFTASGTTEPTDGIFFRVDNGTIKGVIVNNSSAQIVDLGLTYVINKIYHGLIVIHQDRVEFWIDDQMYGYIHTPTALGSPSLSMYLPLAFRQYNTGTVGTAIQTRITKCSVNLIDMNSSRLWASAMSGNGQNAISNPDGAATGQTANYANSAAPTTGTPSNTAAGYTTLGGQWQIAAPAGAETDLILFAFTLPSATPTTVAKNMMVRGIRIEAVNTGAAVATTATVIQWGLGVGSTAVSLATSDSATGGTKAARRLALGYQSFPIGAAIGTTATPLDINFDVPIFVEAGTVFAVLMKVIIGTATASQILRGTVLVNAHYE